MRSSRNLMFVREEEEEEEERETLKFRHGSIFGADLRVPRTFPQIRNRPYEFSQQSPTRHNMRNPVEKNLDWDDILEF